jgi:hypothetical protein
MMESDNAPYSSREGLTNTNEYDPAHLSITYPESESMSSPAPAHL